MRSYALVGLLIFGILTAGCASAVADPAALPLPAERLSLPTGQPSPQPPTPTTEPTPPASQQVIGRADPAPVAEGPIMYGRSFGGRPLVAYRMGDGPIARALVGGLHGGYEWNTTTLMSKTLDYLVASPHLIPSELTLYIIPLANPDGAAAGSDAVVGRMNGNGVDLNRNWDYQWQMTATHGSRPVFAGLHPFSEPETAALRDFIGRRGISAVIFYHSAGAVVYSGAGRESSHTVALAQWIAAQTGYRYAPEGVPGQITTGNAIDWLTVNGITAVEIELTAHEGIDWESNLMGILAFFKWDLPNAHSQIE